MPLHRFATVTAVATWLLLIAGGLVTSTDSGLAVPDWPLSYGMWFPPMVGGILYEHGHRMIAAVVGLMILALALWVARAEQHRWVRWLAWMALAAVIVQALLGGLTVLWLLPPQMSIAHACLGQVVWCLVVCIAVATAPQRAASPQQHQNTHAMAVRGLTCAVAVLAALQLVLGAVIRHTGQLVFVHMGGAAVLLLVCGWLVVQLARVRHHFPVPWGLAWRLAFLLSGQVMLGLMVWSHRASVVMRTGHVALGALVLAQAVILAWETARRVMRVPRTARAMSREHR